MNDYTINTITPDTHPDLFYTPQPHEIQVGQEVWIQEYDRDLGPYKWVPEKVDSVNIEAMLRHSHNNDVRIRKLLTRTTYPELCPDGVQDDLEILKWEKCLSSTAYDCGKYSISSLNCDDYTGNEWCLSYGMVHNHQIYITIRNRFHLERIMADLGIRKEETK